LIKLACECSEAAFIGFAITVVVEGIARLIRGRRGVADPAQGSLALLGALALTRYVLLKTGSGEEPIIGKPVAVVVETIAYLGLWNAGRHRLRHGRKVLLQSQAAGQQPGHRADTGNWTLDPVLLNHERPRQEGRAKPNTVVADGLH